MNQTITYDAEADDFTVTIKIPKHHTGTYLHDESQSWKQNNLCVFINNNHLEFTLNYENYLDYKDSLQVGSSICFFDNKKETESFAKRHGLNIYYHGTPK